MPMALAGNISTVQTARFWRLAALKRSKPASVQDLTFHTLACGRLRVVDATQRGARGEEPMATFVLVHGGWAGSVVWRELAPRLRNAGHEVYAPTLTGIGARKHLLNRE